MRFSPLFAVGLAIAVAVVAGWAGSVQADTLRSLSSCTADCAEQRKALWQQAEDLESQGQYETAAQRYNGVIALAPLSLKAQHAAMRAARCMEQAGDLSQAITFYDQVINIADTRANQEPGTRRLRDYKKEALFSKPHACRQAGMVQQARQTIEQLKAKFPSSSRCVQIGILEAELDGRDTEPAQQLFARDTEAVGLWTQGMHAMGRAEYAQALTLFERVITDYPDTSAALRALENKGRVLLKHKRFSEAGQTFSTLLRNRLGESTRHSRFYRDMRLLLRKALLEELT